MVRPALAGDDGKESLLSIYVFGPYVVCSYSSVLNWQFIENLSTLQPENLEYHPNGTLLTQAEWLTQVTQVSGDLVVGGWGNYG